MKKRYKIIFWLCGIFLVFFLAANILLGAYAPRIVEQQLQQNLKLKCTLGRIHLNLPFAVTLEKLEIGELASIKQISFSPNLAALLFGKIVIHGLTVTEPVINLEQSADGKLNLPVLEQKGKPPEIYLTSLAVRNGKINFKDKKVSPEGFKVTVDKLNVKVAKVALPVTSLATNFSASGQLLSEQGTASGEIDFSGWLDYLAKNLDAQLKVTGLDVTKFSAYYGNFISNRKLSSARLDVISTFKSKSNALEITTKLDLSNLVYAQPKDEVINVDLMKNALDVFTDSKGNLHLEFIIDTLLDNPAISQEKLQKIILKAAAKNLSEQPPEELINKVSSMIDQYKGLGKQIKAILGQ